MAEFSQKIAEIRQDLDALLGTVRNVEAELHEASTSFSELASNAKEISTLSNAIQKLSKFLGSNSSPFLDTIKDRVTSINKELSKLNVTQIETATTALKANAQAMSAVSRAQANTNRNLESAKTLIGQVKQELTLLEQQSGTTGSGLEASIGKIEASLSKINQLTGIENVTKNLNTLDPTKYNQAADALDRIYATVSALKRANISLDISAASEGQKLSKKPIQPVVKDTVIEVPAVTPARQAPQARPKTVQFAQERGVDLNDVQGTGARGVVTKEDVLRHVQSNAPVVDAAAAAAKAADNRKALEARINALNKLDEALASIETARDKAFQAAVKEHGKAKTSAQRDVARKYLIPSDNPNPSEKRAREQDFNEIRKNSTFDDLEAEFLRQLRTIDVDTNLPGDLSSFKASDTKLINTIRQLREAANAEAEKLAKELSGGPSFALSHVVNSLFGRKDRSDPSKIDIDERAKARVKTNTETGAYYTRGNGRLGANADEAAASLAAVTKAVNESPHGIAVVTTTGTNAGAASVIPGAGAADHVLIFFRDLEGKLQALEHLGDNKNLAPGNKLGNVTAGAYAPERRSAEEVITGADSVSALPLRLGTAEQAKNLIAEQTRLTEPGKAVYSFANELTNNQLVAIGDTCATATAEAFERSGILTGIEEGSKFGNVPGTRGANLLTPDEVLQAVARAQSHTDDAPSKLDKLKQDAILSLPGYGIAPQYKINSDRGYKQGVFQGDFDPTLAEGRVDRDPYTGRYTSHGDKIVGTTAEDANATRRAILSAIADSEHGIALVGVSGRSAGGKSASAYDAADASNAADHALVAYLENGIIRIAELLNAGEGGVQTTSPTGAQVEIGTHPGADSFEDVVRSWDYAHAVPINGITPEQADEFKGRLQDNTKEGEAYGLTQGFNDAGELIGESCATAIAKSGREAGILQPDYGLPNERGENTLQPSALVKLFQARNEEYRRGTITQSGPDIDNLEAKVQELSTEFEGLDTEYNRLVQARRALLQRLIAADENLRTDIEDLVATDTVKSVDDFVDIAAKGSYDPRSKFGRTQNTDAQTYAVVSLGLENEFDQSDVGNSKLFKAEGQRAAASDLIEIEKARVRSAQQREQDRLLLANSRPTTSVRTEEQFERGVNTAILYKDKIKEDFGNAKKAAKEYLDRFVAGLKDIFQRIGGTFNDLFSSIGKISFGDIGLLVKGFFKAPESRSIGNGGAAPAFALEDVGDAAGKFSKNVYRPFSFGVSQFGAGLNSVREVAKGAKEGGPGGALDIIGGIIKLLHTIANTNAFFKLNLLPKGVGEIFNQRRSETLLDIAEIGIGASTGHGRTSVDKTYRTLASQEKPLAEKVTELREQVDIAATGGASENEILALRQELAKNIEELRQLRSQINAYRIVLSKEADAETGREQSTGAKLDETTPAFARTFEESTRATYDKVNKFVGESESLLSVQATQSLERFTAGTGLRQGISGGVVAVPQQQALAATKQFFTDAQIGSVRSSQIQGLSAPILDEVGKRIGSVILTTTSQSERRAGVIVHEAVHELVEQSGRSGNALYNGTTRADLAFADTSLEQKRATRLAGINAAGDGGASVDYLFDPKEMFAHIGEALISGNAKLENELRKLYGDDLYDSVIKTLESTLPDTFAPQYLQGLQSKFAAFNLEINDIFKNADASAIDVGKIFNNLASSFNLPTGVSKSIQEKLAGFIPALTDITKNPDAVKRIVGAAQPLLYNEDSFQGRVIRAGKGAGVGELAKQAFDTFQNPSQDNVDSLLASVKKSPDLINKALRKYIADVLNIDESFIGQLAKSSVGKIAGLIVNQLTPDQANFRDLANEKIQGLTGRNLKSGTFQQQSSIDTSTGIERFTLSAQTATGAMIQLNGHVDEFGRKKLDEPEKALNKFGAALHQVVIGGLRQIGDNFTYGIVNAFQEMFRSLIGVQDELGEIANLLGVVGDSATKAKSNFLFQSVGVAVKTGQGFDEAIQTNLKNFKILGAVKDPTQREQLANQVSEVQLGAQTAFGISLEQSLESIPAILATIKDGMDDITDPATKVTKSIEELRDVMDQVVVAQRTTGAQGDELLTVYSRLSASAKEYGLNSKQLLGITAVSSVAIGKGSDETSNILRSFLEGTYSAANQSSFAKNGIATQQFNATTNQIENRSFEDILKDLYALSQDRSKSVDYNQLLQSIAGPKLSPDISKVIQGFGNNYADVATSIDQTPKGAAQSLVAQKSQNFAGSLNKLQATGTQFLGSLLVGTGGFDTAAQLFDRLSASAVKLTSFLNDNEGSIKKIVAAIAPLIKFFAVGFLSKDLNAFSPIAKGLQAVETKFSGTISKLIDFEHVGESGSTVVQKAINLIGVALKELDAGFIRVGKSGTAAFTQVAESATAAAGAVGGPSFALLNKIGGATALPTLINPYEAATAQALNTSGITQAEVANAQQTPGLIRSNVDDFVATAGKPSIFNRARQALEKPGAAIGAIAAPAAFDVISGGLGKDNLTNVGVGIAAGIAGGIVGGPYGAIIGYSIAKSVSESLDVAGIFGTSDNEAKTFAEKLAQVAFNKKPEEGTPEEQKTNAAVAANELKDIQNKLGVDAVKARFEQNTSGNPFAANISTGISANTVKRYLDIQNGTVQPGFLDNIKNSAPTQQVISSFGGNKQLLDLFAGSGLSNVREFFAQLELASQGFGPLAEEFTQLSINTRQQAVASAAVAEADTKRAIFQSSQDLIAEGQKQQTDLQAKLQNDYTTPYGLDKYNAFSPLSQSLNSSFASEATKINSGSLTTPESRQEASGVLDRLARSQESLASLPATLQQLIPLSKSLGLDSAGLEQRLYNIGSQGQSQVAQRFQPAIEADQFTQGYELQQSRLKRLQASDFVKAKDPAILAEVAALQKALATDKARYDINKAFLALLKAQGGALLDQTAAVEAQQKTRQLISAGTSGTPAQFTPASIFDTKGTSATELNNAIDFALRKQSKLEALNPEYRKEFAKDQFLLQSGTDFKGVTGVNQGFVQEYLQQQQKKEAPLQDLSQYSDEQVQKILDQARGLQGQAEKLDPAREGKYDNERLLILRKNNQLLAQTGIGQEFLKAAIDANTKSNDTLRGHYNLPSNYKAPTIFDYYDNGGTEKGDKNFPNGSGQGLVSIAFAQELARQFANPENTKGADLSAIAGTAQPGSKPLFYPNPGTAGTAAIYSEVEPLLLPDTIKSDQNITAAVQRFIDFKQRQIDDLNGASEVTTPILDIEDRRVQQLNKQTPVVIFEPGGNTSGAQPSALQAAAVPRELPNYSGVDDYARGTTVNSVPYAIIPEAETEKTKTNLDQLARNSGKARDDIIGLGTGASKAGIAINAISAALPSAGIGASSLVTSAAAFNGAVTALVAKVAAFDLARALQNSTVNIVINGQAVPASAVTISPGTAVGTNTLTAGSATKSGSKIGGNRQ